MPDRQLQNIIDTFKIETKIKNTANKYLSPSEQWDILKIFYDEYDKEIDNRNHKISLKFENQEETNNFIDFNILKILEK